MSLADELYRETILDHYHNPRNQGILEGDSIVFVEGVNPLCGDELTLYIKVDGGSLADLSLKSRGCSINTASGSMMSETVKGMTLESVEKVIAKFKEMMMNKAEQVELPEEMEDLEALQGVKKYPVRIKCALLPWNTLLEALRCAKAAEAGESSYSPQMVTTE